MPSSRRHQAHDQLLAKIQLTDKRLDGLKIRFDDLAQDVGKSLAERVDLLRQRSRVLRAEVTTWDEVEIGISTEVDELTAEVDTIEADLAAAGSTEPSNYEIAVDHQLRTWRGRLDQLRLQRSLAAMEMRDDLEQLVHRLDVARGEVLVELQDAAADSKDLVIDVRTGLEDVLGDVRRTVEKAASELTKR